MIYLLLLSLILLFCLIYLSCNREILNPSSIFAGTFILGTAVAARYVNDWNVDISITTYLVILSAVIMFFLGEVFSKQICLLNRNNLSKVKQTDAKINYEEISISSAWIILISLIEIVVFYFDFKYTYKLSMLAGNIYGVEYMLNFAYYAYYNQQILLERSTLLTLGNVFSNSSACIMLYVFIGNTILVKCKRSNLKYLIPVIIYLAQSLLATGRTRFFRLIIVMLILTFVMMKDKSNWSSRNNGKIIRYGFIGAAIFFIVYRLYGLLRGSIHSEWDQIISYIGKPIIALDNYLRCPSSSEFFGSETLTTIHGILRKLGYNIPYKSIALEYTSWGNTGTNIYTAFRRYIHDYSVAGLLIIPSVMGFIYGYLFNKIRNGQIGLILLMYSMFIYPVFESIFEERFLISILSAGTVYTVILTIILFNIFTKKKVRDAKHNDCSFEN